MAFTLASFLVTCALCFGIFHLVTWHLRRRRLYELASKFEGPPVLPIIGNAHLFVGNSEHILNQIYKTVRSYSSPCRVWLGSLLLIGVSDPEQIKTICQSPKTLGKSYIMEKLCEPILGEGLLAASATRWKVHRKLIQPTFNTKILASFVEIFAAQARTLTDQMKRHLDGPEFGIFELFSLCTLDMICETAMGVRVGAQTNTTSQYVEAVEGALATMSGRIFRLWLHPELIFYRTKLGKDHRKYIKFLDDFVHNITQIKKKEFVQRQIQLGTADNSDDACDLLRQGNTFLENLMKLTDDNDALSDKELRDEVMTMILTGNDTSANVMTSLTLMLASHPDVQDKVYKELYEIYGDADVDERPVEPKDLMRMKYMERVIKETMRLFPVVPLIIREISEELNIGEHTIPAKASVFIGILNLHRNEKYWPDPLKFDPDRFLPEEMAKRHPYAYMAFSGGARNCVGQQYAMFSMKTVIATVLRKYILKKDNIVPVEDIRLKFEMVSIPVDPITLRIERRTRNQSEVMNPDEPFGGPNRSIAHRVW